MEHPNPLIDDFSGILEYNELRIPILHQNVLLRGCVLRSTEFVIGIVVNTGHDVKINYANKDCQEEEEEEEKEEEEEEEEEAAL